MRAVVQRVSRASVEVEGQIVARIGTGLLVLLGVAKDDAESDVQYVANKITNLRIFADDMGKMNLAVSDVKGSLLVVSQFTLVGDTNKGRRPGFDGAAAPEQARAFYESMVTHLRSGGMSVETGQFGAQMKVELVNDGPVTFLIDSRQHG